MKMTRHPPDRLAAEAALRADPNIIGYPPADLELILAACEWRNVPAGTKLFSAGDQTSAVHAIAEGFVAVESSMATPDLPLVSLMQGPFWLVGRPQLQGRIRLATVTARTPLVVGVISQARFDALAAKQPSLQNFKAWVAGDLFWVAMAALADALIPDNRHRAISTLLRVTGRKHAGDTPASAPITQSELASITNLSRQTCGQLLRGFEGDGLIRLGYREIEVLQPALLRAMIA